MAVTLEDKIQLFGKTIFGNIESEASQKRQKLVEQYQKELDKLKEEIAGKRVELIGSSEARGERERKRIITQVRNEEQHRYVEIKQEAIQRIMQSLREKAADFAAAADYRGYMEKSIGSVFKRLGNAKHITIYVMEEDIELCQEILGSQLENPSAEIKYEVKKASQNIIGGLIAEDHENLLQVESTLKALIEENRDTVGAAVTRSFNEVSG